MKKLVCWARVLGVVLGSTWGGLLVYWGTYGPTFPDNLAGRIYPYNYHGTVVYLTFTEQVLKFALPATAFFLILGLQGLAARFRNSDKQWPPDTDDY